LERLRGEQPTAVFSEQALQKRLERARKFVLVAKTFGTAVLDSPELLNFTKIGVLTFEGLGEMLRQKQVESGRNQSESGEYSQTRIPMEWTRTHSVPLN